jgi:gamma-glutamyltranspeptidase
MGADGQPQIHVQTYVAMIDYGLDIQQALYAPRWLSRRFALGEARDTLHIEGRYPRETIDELERAAIRSTAGATGTSSPAMRTASPSIRAPASAPAAPIRAATAPPWATEAGPRRSRQAPARQRAAVCFRLTN